MPHSVSVPRARPGAVSYGHAAFRPYVIAIGQLALAWNELHETMGLLFCTIMGGGVVNQYLSVWHALRVDRAQREILKAAAISDTRDALSTRYLDDVKWLCGQADTLEDARNDAIHSPLLGMRRSSTSVVVMPRTGLGHFRANKLADRGNLLAEFRRCRDASLILAKFALDMDLALMNLNDKHPWPDRPRLPSHSRTRSPKPAKKAQRPRSQSSQGDG